MQTKKTRKTSTRILIGLGVLIFWIGVWAIASAAVHQELLIPAPWVVCQHLFKIVTGGSFFRIIFTSFLRVLGGFLSGCLFGMLLAVVCSLSQVLDAVLRPVVRIISSIPVTSFIILVMLWLPYTYVPVFISALLVIPIVFGNVRTGIEQTDPSLLEVARIYRFGHLKTLRFVYIPSVLPFFASGAVTALGLAWKAGIAAEVLAQPKQAIGSQMYFSKLYLETADLFAWTLIVILFSYLLEKLVEKFIKKPSGKTDSGKGDEP